MLLFDLLARTVGNEDVQREERAVSYEVGHPQSDSDYVQRASNGNLPRSLGFPFIVSVTI